MKNDKLYDYFMGKGFVFAPGNKESGEQIEHENYTSMTYNFEPTTFTKDDFIVFYHSLLSHVTIKKADETLFTTEHFSDEDFTKVKEIFRKYLIDDLLNG